MTKGFTHFKPPLFCSTQGNGKSEFLLINPSARYSTLFLLFGKLPSINQSPLMQLFYHPNIFQQISPRGCFLSWWLWPAPLLSKKKSSVWHHLLTQIKTNKWDSWPFRDFNHLWPSQECSGQWGALGMMRGWGDTSILCLGAGVCLEFSSTQLCPSKAEL